MSDYHNRIMNIATEPGIEELERGDRLLYKYGHQVARHAAAEIAAEAEEEITRLQSENEELRAAIRRLCNIYVVDDYYMGQLREERLEAAVNRAINAPLADYRKGGGK